MFDNIEECKIITETIPTQIGNLKLFLMELSDNVILENHPWVIVKV
ncbi:MAG: hypothetical protein Q8934_19700 [Bacillota bacterium]|nr:hypothetical protein [Bacillota bacterium]